MPEDKTFERVLEREREMQAVYDRMKADEDLLHLAPYEMKDLDGKRVSNMIYVTLNKPAVFGAVVKSALITAEEQIEVQSADHQLDAAFIEDFQRAVLAQANGILTLKGEPTLANYAVDATCFRGRVAARCLMRTDEKTGNLIPDIMPWDTQFVTEDTGDDGLEWACYRMQRTSKSIEKTYGKTIEGKRATVRDIWFPDHNEVWVDKDKVREEQHTYGYVPVVYIPVPLGYGDSLKSENNEVYRGESIFFLIRHLVPELNRLATIMQTINFKLAKHAMVYRNEAGKQGELGEYEDVTAPGSVTSIGLNENLTPVEIGDINRSALQLYQILEKAMQQGSVSDIELGSLQFELSAVALVEVAEGRDQVFRPRLLTRAMFHDQLSRMFTKQIIDMGGTVELGVEGHKRKFNTTKLKGEYTTTYKYFTKSPKGDMARMSLAQVAERFYGRRTTLAKILQEQDPDAIVQERYYDLAETISPLILRNRIIKSLIHIDPFEAKLMAIEAGQTLQAILNGEPPEQPKLPGPGQSLFPMMLNNMGEVSSNKKAADLQRTPKPIAQEPQ